MPTKQTSTIRFVRPSRFADLVRRYKLFVNGRQVGVLGASGTLEVEVAPGPQEILARLDWCRSEPLRIETTPGQTVGIDVTNDWSPLLAIWAVTFGHRKYLTLKVIRSA